MNEKKLFEDFCFLPDWTEAEVVKSQVDFIPHKKDLTTLLAELEDINNNIEQVKSKVWHLAKLSKFHQKGFA
ncbi:MAG: hypothetical protein R3Y28_08340 [Candidatus Gastranaerophilales bacterium]